MASTATRSPTALIALVAVTTASAAAPAAAADFYAGKSIDLVIGAPPGGGYDIYARVVGRHLGRHIPGQPAIVPKNMPGAASGRAAGYISAIAPKDGTAIAAVMPGAVMGPLLDEKAEALFDPTKVNYLGTANNGNRVCVTLKGTKIKSFDDVLAQKAVFGGVSTNDSTYEYGHLLKRTAGAQYDVVSGYRGTPDIALAMERGEVDGVCGWDWSSFKSQKPDWLRDNKVNVILQVGLEPHAELTRMGVPSVFKYVERGRPQSGRAGDQPAGVPAVLYRTAGHPGGAAQHAAHRLRRDHGRQAVPRRRRKAAHRDLAAARRQGAGAGAEAALGAEGRGRAGAAGDQAVSRQTRRGGTRRLERFQLR
jgi:hypothetical protein